MARLEKLFTKGEPGDREAALTAIEGVLDVIRTSPMVGVRNIYKTIFNQKCHASDAVYFNAKKLYIPESIVSGLLSRDTYFDVETIVTILDNTRYNHRRIIPPFFYESLTVATPVDKEEVDCLVFNYPILRRISSDIDSKE